MTQGTRVKGKGSKEVRSRVGTALWLLAAILVAGSGSAAGFQVRPEPAGVSHGAGSLTAEARFARPSVLPRGAPRVVAIETDRQKPIRGHDGKRSGIIPQDPSLPLVIHGACTPILRSHVLWSALVRAFEPRGPPSRIA